MRSLGTLVNSLCSSFHEPLISAVNQRISWPLERFTSMTLQILAMTFFAVLVVRSIGLIRLLIIDLIPEKLKWKFRRWQLKGRMDSLSECALGYKPEWNRWAEALYYHETAGIKKGYITERERMVM